jgi:hypothetical protein
LRNQADRPRVVARHGLAAARHHAEIGHRQRIALRRGAFEPGARLGERLRRAPAAIMRDSKRRLSVGTSLSGALAYQRTLSSSF